jgi:transcriptional regulator with PAS, ATPase and Fis domain
MGQDIGELSGFLFVSHAGGVLHATGAANDSRIIAMMTDPNWMAEARRKRLQTISIDRKAFAGLVIPEAEGDILLLSEPPGVAVLDFIASVDFAYDIIHHLLTDPFDAMTVVDDQARITYISPIHERFFGLEHGEANGRPVREIIENTRLDEVVKTGRAEVGEIQRMRGSERVVTRVPVTRGGALVGAVGRIMFKGPKQLEALNGRISALESQVEFYKREAAALRRRSYGPEDIIGDSPAIRKLRNDIVKLAALEIPVLVRGESGTGKELVAHALHRLSPRRDNALVMVNSAALPPTLVEAELFGYEAGAFTGADKKGRKGKFELAAGGTIFLDEIGDMPKEIQAKLLRVLQDRMVERIGSERPREVDFRLVSATNHDLQKLVQEGGFRLDLYYRVSPLVLEVPPLRERIEDIPILARHFLSEVAARHRQPEPELMPDALALLMEQAWPGNVRQLRHEIERIFVFCEGGRITAEDIQPGNGGCNPFVATPEIAEHRSAHDGQETLRQAVERAEDGVIRSAMERFGGNKKRVAEELGISRSYLYKKLGLAET